MSEAYAFFAKHYDRFMEEAPYEAWVDWIGETLQSLDCYEGPSLKILDLGCGTGNIAIPLAVSGHHVVGTDLSEPMVKIAEEKSSRLDADIQRRLKWRVQHMAHPNPPEEVYDAVICCCDSLNYLTDQQEVKNVFRHVRATLHNGGLFLFDVHTPQQLQNYFAEQPYIWNDPDVAYIWTCDWANSETIVHELVLFAENGQGTFERIEEKHHQRVYRMEWLKETLREMQLEPVQITSDFSPFAPMDESRRMFFVCVAI